VPSLATDGKHLFYHPAWVLNNTQAVVEAGVAHEVGHCALNHMGRKGARDNKRWNHAADYATNAMLEDCGFEIPPDWVHDPVFKGMSAEHIYSLLPPADPDDKDDSFDEHLPPDPADAGVQQAEWEVATIQAAQAQQAQGRGNMPDTIQRFIDELTQPKVDWRSVLRRFATSASKGDYSWARPNRAYLSIGIILPGLYSEKVEDATVMVDTSGSITKEVLTAFASEIDDIRTSVIPTTTRVIYCDAAVNHVDEFEQHDMFHVEPHGGGGTDFCPPFDWLKANDKTPSFAVYLTDGYGRFPTTPPPYPVLWVMTTDVQPPWGECVRIEL
jgi:predicted metal-dependent peptidase